jgi:septal ring factor EnvC (AmiA/AmiB activator)
VRHYDRAWWRLRQETGEVRKSLLQTQEHLAALEKEAEEDEDQAELEGELDRRDEEILRLRDLLIGMDSELGAAKGRLTEIEDRAKRMAAAKLRVESQVPVFGKLLGTFLNLVRGSRS